MKALVTTPDGLRLRPWAAVKSVADSAIARQKEPIWLDEENPMPMAALVCPCYKIGRLGLNIDPRFAHRYIDAAGVVAIVLPDSWVLRPMDAPDLLYACNGAMVLGDEAEVQSLGDSVWQLTVTSDCPGAPERLQACGITVTTGGMDFGVEAVWRLSRYMTFKTGDRIIDISNPVAVPLKSGKQIEASLAGQALLKVKAK